MEPVKQDMQYSTIDIKQIQPCINSCQHAQLENKYVDPCVKLYLDALIMSYLASSTLKLLSLNIQFLKVTTEKSFPTHEINEGLLYGI